MAKISDITQYLTTGEEVIIRNPRAEDAFHLIAFLQLILTDGSGMVAITGEVPTDIDEQRLSIENFLQNERALLLAAFCDSLIVGYLDFRPQTRARLKHSGEFGISVSPQWRGKGLGKFLMAAFLDWAQNSPVEKVNLRVRADNPRARALYESLGFTEQGHLPQEIKLEDGSYVDDVSMYKFV